MPKHGPLRWHGGKSYLAPKIIELMPPHTRYCEPFFGGGAVLLQKPCEGVAEYANDLNHLLICFLDTLRDTESFNEFCDAIYATPFSEPHFVASKIRCHLESLQCSNDRIGAAVAFFTLNRQSRQGLMRDFATPTSRLRRGMNEQVSAWLSAVEGLPEFHTRLKRVEIRCMDAIDFIKELDSPETCFYCDPPYLHETRSSTGEYAHEMAYADHEAMLCLLSGIKGKFLLSGYRSDLYDTAAGEFDWRRVDFPIPNQASNKRQKEIKTECVWMNY